MNRLRQDSGPPFIKSGGKQPQPHCCCQPGKCLERNAEQEGKRYLTVDGEGFCCKQREKQCSTTLRTMMKSKKYTKELDEVKPGLSGLYNSSCALQCSSTCSGHGMPFALLEERTQRCACACDQGHDSDGECSQCIAGHGPGYGGNAESVDEPGCRKECSSADVDCHERGHCIGFLGKCRCECMEGHDPTSRCDKCLPGFGRVTLEEVLYWAQRSLARAREVRAGEVLHNAADVADGIFHDVNGSRCVRECTDGDVDCNGKGVPAGYAGLCSCQCEVGLDPMLGCSRCLPGWFADWDGVCHHPSEFEMCIATMNAPYKATQANLKAVELVQRCNNSDILFIMTQEMTQSLKSTFNDFATDLLGYVPIGRCGNELSAGIVAFRKDTPVLRKLFPLGQTQCPKAQKDTAAWSNVKGTAFMSISMAFGTLVLASTHGTRGGTIMPERVEAFQKAINTILDLNPTVAVWGGDFNMRTPLEGSVGDKLLRLLRLENPRRIHEVLASQPDILGIEGRDTALELKEASGGRLEEVDGLRNLCPSYRKVPSAEGAQRGAWSKMKGRLGGDQQNGQVDYAGLENNGAYKGKALVCRAPGSDVDEYYRSPLDGETTWEGESSRAPSWVDRIFVSKELRPGCEQPRKIISDKDHDIVFTKCKMGAASLPE